MSEVRILSPRPARPGRMAPDRYRQTKTLADQRSRTNGMKARIYQPTKTAMQSGKALTRQWRLDYDTAGSRFVEPLMRSEEHTSELQSLMRISYAVFCLKKKNKVSKSQDTHTSTTYTTYTK